MFLYFGFIVYDAADWLYWCIFRFNRIQKISVKSLADLRKLELLLIHGNDIHSLPDGVFGDLQSLQVHNKHQCPVFLKKKNEICLQHGEKKKSC